MPPDRTDGEDAPGGLDFNDRDGELEVMLPVPIIGGWLFAARGYGRVEVRVDDRDPVSARLFTQAPSDRVRTSDDPSAPLAGWTAQLDLRGAEVGTRFDLTATAYGSAGELELGSAQLIGRAPPALRLPDTDWLFTLAMRASAEAAAHTPGSGLRLLAFTHDLGLGGAQLYLVELLGYLLRDPEVSCTVISPEDGALRERLERAGAEVHLSTSPGHGDSYESHIRELAVFARARETNAVIANTALSFHGIDLAGRLGIPALWAIHESLNVDQLLWGGDFVWADGHVTDRLRAALSSADAVLFEADATRRIWAEETANSSNFARVDYGIELGEIDESRARLDRERLREAKGIGPLDRVILCPGTLDPRKAQASLAIAFARIADEHPDAILTLVGRGLTSPDYSAGAEEVIGRLDLPGRIRIETITPALHDWYTIADFVVVASDNESLPRVILEAMAFGLPVLGTRVFGIPELIEDGVNGLLCEAQDLDSLEQGLRRLLSLASDEAAELGRAGEATVRPERDSVRYAEKVRTILHELLAGREVSSANPLG